MSAPIYGPLRRRRFQVAMHAYFDDATTFQRSKSILLAGYVADDQEWEALTREWKILLAKHHMDRLHTADFMAARSREYARYADSSFEERTAIVREFFMPIRKHILCGFVVGVDAAVYREVFSERKRKPSPEEFCFIRLMRLLMTHLSMWTDPFPLNLVFDDSQHSMRFHGLYRARKKSDPTFDRGVAGITFADDKLVPALQAADLLAWVMSQEAHKPIGTWMEDSKFDDILNATDPAHGKLHMGEYWEKELFNKHSEAFLAATWKGDL